MRDISDRKRAEEALRQSEERYKTLVENVDIGIAMFGPGGDIVQANPCFAQVVGMIRLQWRASRCEEAKSVCSEMAERVSALSHLYELLYSSNSITEIRLDKYCAKVVSSLRTSSEVLFEQSYEPMIAHTKLAAPVGLILTELVTNATKHAFPEGSKGTVRVFLTRADGTVTLEIRDNGMGISDDASSSSGVTLGLSLVRGLTSQIGGTFTISSEGGTRCVVQFPLQ